MSAADLSNHVVRLGLRPHRAVPVVAAVSGLAAALADHAPTGTAWFDVVLRVGFAAAVPAIAARVRPTSLMVASVLALVFSGGQTPSLLLAIASTALTLAMTAHRRWDPASSMVVRAVAGSQLVHAALHLPDIRRFGTSALFAAIVLAPVALAAWQTANRTERRWLARGAIGVAVFSLLAGLAAGLSALSLRVTVLTAIDDAELAIEALEDGRQDDASAALAASAAGFEDAERVLGGPLHWPARMVPILAQNSRSLEVAATEGRNLTAAAATTLGTADVRQIRGANGAIDLELVAAVRDELDGVVDVLASADASLAAVRTPWLVPQLDERLQEVEREIAALQVDVDLAHHAATAVPRLLGGEGTRTYLVLFVQPAESREYGGFVGAYGLLQASQGRLTMGEVGSLDDAVWEGEAVLTDPGRFPEHYFEKRPELHPQNLTMIPDLETISRAASDLAPQWRGEPDFRIDGVMTIDPYGLAGLLELSGPVAIPGRPAPLHAGNVTDYLLRQQYLDAGDEIDERRSGLRLLAAASFTQLLSIELPGPERLGEIFGPLARGNRIAFYAFDEYENEFLERVFLDADLPVASPGSAMIGVFHGSAVAGKLDAYHQRHLNYRVALDPEARTSSGTLQIVSRNDVPDDAPAYVRGLSGADLGAVAWQSGNNHVVLNLYTRERVLAVESTGDGGVEPSEVRNALSYNHQSMGLMVAPGEERTVTIRTAGSIGRDRYDLLVAAQPMAVPATFRVEVVVPAGWEISRRGEASFGPSVVFEGELDEHLTIATTVREIGSS